MMVKSIYLGASVGAIFCLSIITGTVHSAHAVCVPPAYQKVAREYAVPADILYAISLAESGRQTQEYGFSVWPWALNISGRSYYPKTKASALVLVQNALAENNNEIALGAMQVYWRFHRALFKNNPQFALDVAANLRAGAQIFRGFLDQAPDVWTAVGYYYAGASSSFKARQAAATYTQRVQRLHAQYVEGYCDEWLVDHY